MNTSTSKVGRFSIVAAATLIASLLIAAPADASPEGDAVEMLRQSSMAAAAGGDVTAAQNVRAVDALTDEQHEALIRVLTDTSDLALEPPARASVEATPGGSVATDGDARWTAQVGTDSNPGTRAATRSIWATQTFSFAGIQLTQVKTWGNYTVNVPNVARVTDWGTQVVKNYQPLTSVSSTKQSAVISGGTVTFKARVTVNRGPAPGLGGNWSTKQSYHTVKANYIGTVLSNSWT